MLEMSEEEISVLSAPAVDASAVDIGPKSVHMKQQRRKLLPNKTYNSRLGILYIVKMDRVVIAISKSRDTEGRGHNSLQIITFQLLNQSREMKKILWMASQKAEHHSTEQ